jgi:hypothetical protein
MYRKHGNYEEFVKNFVSKIGREGNTSETKASWKYKKEMNL